MGIDILIVSYWRFLDKWDLRMLSLRVGPKTSHLLNGSSNQLSYERMCLYYHESNSTQNGSSKQLSYESMCLYYHESNSGALMKIDLLIVSYWGLLHKWDIRTLILRVELKTSLGLLT